MSEKLLAYIVIITEQKLKANIFQTSLLPLFNCVFRQALKIGVVRTGRHTLIAVSVCGSDR